MLLQLFNSSILQLLYSLLVFRDYINKLRPPVKGVAMKIKNLINETETLSESVRTSNYVKYLDLQHYEHGMQYDAHERRRENYGFFPPKFAI